MEAKLYSCGVFDSQLANYEKASHHRLFTDATVTVDGRNFQLHKHVLATSSPVFERMFSSEMQEGEGTLLCPSRTLSQQNIDACMLQL